MLLILFWSSSSFLGNLMYHAPIADQDVRLPQIYAQELFVPVALHVPLAHVAHQSFQYDGVARVHSVLHHS